MGSNPLKWYGGKQYLADWIIAHFPPHTHYVEPYFGGGAVFFAKPDHLVLDHSEVINDINASLTNFWSVLQSDLLFEQFYRRVVATPMSQAEFDTAMNFPCIDNVERAVAFFIKYRQSREGKAKTFATLSKNRIRRRMNEQASAWWSAIDGLDDAHTRLERVVILSDDALRIIRQEDSANTFFYLDPPYLHDTRVSSNDYEFEMSADAHEELLKLLTTIKGKFLLSGYHSKLYDDYTKANNWVTNSKSIDVKCSNSKKKAIRQECLWMNY